MSKITITREALVAERACEEGLEDFDAAYPSGVTKYDPTSHEDAARILGGPMAGWWTWAVEEGVAVPFRLTVGDHGCASAGCEGAATVGDYGAATVGSCGTARAGREGTIVIAHYEDLRRRLVVGYIGETLDAAGEVLEADTPYRLDDGGRFVRAKTTD